MKQNVAILAESHQTLDFSIINIFVFISYSWSFLLLYSVFCFAFSFYYNINIDCVLCSRQLWLFFFSSLNHDKCFFATEQKRILINHSLYDVFQIWSQLFEMAHVGEFNWNQCWPPANSQVLAVHAVQFGIFGYAVWIEMEKKN